MKFSRLQLFFVLLLSIGISNHVLLIPHLLQASKRDAWICIIIGFIFLLLWGYILSLIISKNNKEKLFIWLVHRTNKPIAIFIISLFMLYIGISGIIIVYDFIQTVHIYLLPMTPKWIVALPFLLLCVMASYKELKTIVYLSIILLPAVWILGHFVAITTMTDKDYSYMFPIFTQGSESLIQGTIIVLGASTDIIILLLLQQHVKKSFNYLNIIILAFLLMGLTLGPTIGSISAFGPYVAAHMRFPAFEQWRLVTLGELVSHVDFLAVFQLLCGVTIRLTFFLFLIYDIVESKSNVIKRNILIIYSIILGVFSISPISDIWFQTVLRYYFYPSAFFFGILISLILLIISFIPEKKGVENNYEDNTSI